MPRLPRPSGVEMVKFLEGLGFSVVRIHGSHHVMTRGSSRTVVPVHGRETLKIGTLRCILRDIEMSAQEFTRLWES